MPGRIKVHVGENAHHIEPKTQDTLSNSPSVRKAGAKMLCFVSQIEHIELPAQLFEQYLCIHRAYQASEDMIRQYETYFGYSYDWMNLSFWTLEFRRKELQYTRYAAELMGTLAQYRTNPVWQARLLKLVDWQPGRAQQLLTTLEVLIDYGGHTSGNWRTHPPSVMKLKCLDYMLGESGGIIIDNFDKSSGTKQQAVCN